jgi:hypothetical protein
MTQDRGMDSRKAARAPFPPRSRRRWALAGGFAAAWLVLYLIAGSVISATLLLVALAATAAIAVGVLRSMGVTRDHPWIRQLASRPWRDGQDVLRVAMNHLPDVFVVAPSGALFAPNVVEIQLNPEDLASLCDRIELNVVTASVTEFYEEQIVKYRARFATPERAEVYLLADEWGSRGAATASGKGTRPPRRPSASSRTPHRGTATRALTSTNGTGANQPPTSRSSTRSRSPTEARTRSWRTQSLPFPSCG